MIINTLKHLRSRGSERAPERAGDERREGGKRRGGRMVMTLVHMICGIDSANHLVPMATPLGREQTHASNGAGEP